MTSRARDLPRPDGDRRQGDAVRVVRGGHVHEGDDAPVHVLLRVEQGLRGQPERAGRSLIDLGGNIDRAGILCRSHVDVLVGQ